MSAVSIWLSRLWDPSQVEFSCNASIRRFGRKAAASSKTHFAWKQLLLRRLQSQSLKKDSLFKAFLHCSSSQETTHRLLRTESSKLKLSTTGNTGRRSTF